MTWASRAGHVRAVLAVAAVCAATACTEVTATPPETYEPSHLEEVEGKDFPRVVFTEEGAERTGMETATVESIGGQLAVPYDAVIYDPQGKTFVYTTADRLSFVHEEITIERVEGRRALLTQGPPAGTVVVTTGAAEVYGAELEIGGSH